MRTIDLDSLEIFRAVVEEGGILRAAEKLNRVPSNITTRVKQLEKRLGTPLFRKQGRSLVLSREGELLLSYAERLFRLADEAESELSSGALGGVFKIGSLESTAGSRLPPILSRFHRDHPGVIVELVTGTSGALVQRVASFEIEAAFVSEPFTLACGMDSRIAFDEELVLITPKGSPLVKKATDVAGMTLIAFSDGCSYRRRMQEWLATSDVMPSRTLEFASYQAMIACVAAGTGFALVPRSLLHALRTTNEVQQHDVPQRFSRNQTHLIWNGLPSSSLRKLIAMIRR